MTWDDAGDREVQRFEALLSVYRCNVPAPDFARVVPLRSRRRWKLAVAAAAAIVAIVVASSVFFRPRPNEWRATAVSGSASLPRRALRAGDVIHTDSTSRVHLESRAVGVIDLDGATTVRLIESRNGRQRIALDVGMIHAKTTSPPGVFVVDTPRARAIDLGCEYVLSIARGGGGELRVTSGWVDLTHGYEQSLVPQGASAAIESDGSLTVPVFDDAVPAFHAAIRNHDMPTIVALARTRDALTLLNLFRDSTPDERGLLYDRLNQLVPAPPSITRESVRYWMPSSTELWWTPVIRASGLQGIKKKKGALSGL